MILDKYITVITFIPWILLYIVSTFNNLNNKNYQEFNFKYFKKNIFKIFRIDTLFLICVFYYFASFNKEFVNKYLFAVICIYLFVNSFYDQKERLKKGFFKNNFFNIILLIIFMFIPLGIYAFNHNLVLTYKTMLWIYFIEYIFIIIICLITQSINKLFKRK